MGKIIFKSIPNIVLNTFKKNGIRNLFQKNYLKYYTNSIMLFIKI